MKKVIIAFATLMAITIGCSEEELDGVTSDLTPATVEFMVNEIQLTENAQDSLVTIGFSKSLSKSGVITLVVTSANKVTTNPALQDGKLTLSVAAGSSKVSFRVRPVDNSLLDGHKVVSFQIQSTSEGLLIGEKKISTLKINDDESPVQVSFPLSFITASESLTDGQEIVVPFSAAAAAEGTVQFAYSSDLMTYGQDYTFEPAATNGAIMAFFQKGSTSITLKIKPINDQLFNGDRVVRLRILHATGGVIKGENNTLDIKITDDESTGFSKGYKTGTTIGWSSSRYFQYNADGTISRIVWELFAPNRTSGQYTYEYLNGKVVRENEYAGRYSTFAWENGKITKQETFVNGSLAEYKLFGYDQAGNVGEAALFYRQPDGSFKMSFLMVYLYFTDGNLYKQMVYTPIPDSDDYSLLETRTYSGYLANHVNPFPMEILPNIKAQINLPTGYELDKDGKKLSYNFTYEFNTAGKVTKRTTTGTSSEVTTYEYF